METLKFTGKNSRDVLRKVKETLGEDAVIMTNRTVGGEVEVTAVAASSIDLETYVHTKPASSTFESKEEYAVPQSKVDEVMSILTLGRNTGADYAQRIILNNDFSESVVKEPEDPVYFVSAGQSFEDRFIAHRENFTVEKMAFSESVIETELNKHAFAKQIVKAVQAEVLASEQPVVYVDFDDFDKPATTEVQVANHPEIGQPVEQSSVVGPELIQQIFSEMRSLRSQFDNRLGSLEMGQFNHGNHAKRALTDAMNKAGFGNEIIANFTQNLPSELTPEQSIEWAKQAIFANLKVEADMSEIIDKGGVFALIGPTGVGKTTTVAKLGAQFVMKHGTSKLAFITTDAYRIGAHEQLRIYGKILGVAVHTVKDEADLKIVLKELEGMHTILIDTVGVSQRDKMVAEQIAMLTNAGNGKIKKLLCLNSTSTRETLIDVVSAYGSDIDSGGITSCIITKVDEAGSIGNVLEVAMQKNLTIQFMTNGQRVPEDILLADKNWISQDAFVYDPLIIASTQKAIGIEFKPYQQPQGLLTSVEDKEVSNV